MPRCCRCGSAEYENSNNATRFANGGSIAGGQIPACSIGFSSVYGSVRRRGLRPYTDSVTVQVGENWQLVVHM